MKIELEKKPGDTFPHSIDLDKGTVYLDRDDNICMKVDKGSVILRQPNTIGFYFSTDVRGVKKVFGNMTFLEKDIEEDEEKQQIVFAQKRFLEL